MCLNNTQAHNNFARLQEPKADGHEDESEEGLIADTEPLNYETAITRKSAAVNNMLILSMRQTCHAARNNLLC